MDLNKNNIGLFVIGARLLFITWLTKNTFSKRTQMLLLYSLFTIPKIYLLPAKRKVSYMSGKLSMSVLYWIFSNHLHSYCIHCKRRGMQQCHVFLNCCHVEKMTQVFLGRPLFLFPWGFLVSACLVMIDVGFPCVWPIQRHFLRFISISTGTWFVLVHRVLLLTLSDHFTFMILRRHLFTNVCILFIVCLEILHVSELYNITDLTLELNILILVFSLISFDFQILLSMRKATRAFSIRALVSSSVPPVLLILLPRYVKQSVSSSGFPPTVTTFLLFVLS